jgi:hypothetical protein
MTMPKHFADVVCKITFPNGKIHIGKDIGRDGHSLRYFGAWNNLAVAADFSKDQLRSPTLRKDILFESDDKAQVTRMESQLTLEHRACNPVIGYNGSHRRSRHL